jgi:hypothetical protein
MYGLLFLPLMIWGSICFFRNRRKTAIYQLCRAFGWISLCVFPVPFLAAARQSIEDFNLGETLLLLLGAPLTWPIFLGGQTVIRIFEDNVKHWTGHRRDTMFDNAHVFFGLILVQVLLLSLLVAWRFQQGKTWRDPVVLGVGIFMAGNAMLGMNWPWYGD